MNCRGYFMKGRIAFFMAALFVAGILHTYRLWGQTSSGEITGRVADPTDAAIANAEVTLMNRSTGEKRVTRTSISGEFVFTALQPGLFAVAVKVQGFKELEKTDLKLSA